MEGPLLSVIVPIYNTEKFLEKCLLSVRSQSYKNIEILCVDDASPDGCRSIVERLASEDGRIRLLKHAENKGLFHARLTGICAARGEYVAFVDSDDFVSCDWFRPLIEKAEAERADMVVGNTVMVDESGRRTYYNYFRALNRNRPSLEGEELKRAFFAQHGECFLWHTVWNKVYRRSLFLRAFPALEKMQPPLVMGEDIAFSCVLYTMAEKMAFCDNDCYFYLRHGQASTSITLPPQRIRQNIRDIVRVFAFAEAYLKEAGIAETVQDDFFLFRQKYFRIWSGNLRAAGMEKDAEAVSALLNGFSQSALGMPDRDEFYFYRAQTEWDEKLEELRYKLRAETVETVSFDIFDTLIFRPFWEPTDLFYAVGLRSQRIVKDPELFRAMRLGAEEKCRAAERSAHGGEDVTLSEIYAFMREEFGFTKEETAALQAAEEEIELSSCYPRACGKMLYELARAENKKVILVSDMYMEEEHVRKILKKCGYAEYGALYLSSSLRKVKGGTLFGAVLAREGTAPGRILHIGDNWNADILAARAQGMRALFLPKATETYTNNISNIYTGDAFKSIYAGSHRLFDSRGMIGQIPLRCLFACAANGAFDDPFNSFNRASRYNADPYFAGYTALGMHLFGVAKWIYDTAKREGYERIVFLARDGELAMRAFRLFYGDQIASDYFYAGRKLLLPYAVKGDLYGLLRFIDVREATPDGVLALFAPVCRELTLEGLARYRRRGIETDKPLRSKENFFRFADAMKEISYDERKADGAFRELSVAFTHFFSGKCACFDIGYSGKLQKAIGELAGKPVDCLYIHGNGYETERLARDAGFKVHRFYDFSPTVSGVLREFLISDPSASGAGYEILDGEVRPRLAANVPSYAEEHAVRELQRGALDYCAYIKERLGDWLGGFYCRPTEVSLPFENFLLDATPFDRGMFSASYVEDEVYGGYARKNFCEIWDWQLGTLPAPAEAAPEKGTQHPSEYHFLKDRSKFAKAFFYWSFDREKFREKMKARRAAKKAAKGGRK